MKQDRLVEVNTLLAAQAFDAWMARKGRAQRHSQQSSAEQFLVGVEQQIQGAAQRHRMRSGLPTSKSTWSDWRNGRRGPRVRVRADVCEAIFALTDCDITVEALFTGAARNFTDVATLGEPRFRRISNAPVDEKEIYDIILSYIDFRQSGTIEVTSDWFAGAPVHPGNIHRIGTVKWGLREAAIDIVCTGEITAKLVAISAGESTEYGGATGCNLIEDIRQSGRWLVQAKLQETLHGRAINLHLCHIQEKPGNAFKVIISALPEDAAPKFHFDFEQDHGSSHRRNTQQQLISRILALKYAPSTEGDRRLLSKANVPVE